MIRFEGVTKTFPDGTTAVGGLTLEAASGRITVLVGPSGCGKTTSLRMVNRMVEPSSGRVLLAGEDVATLEPSRRRRRIGYVIQSGGLFPHRTGRGNVMTVPLLLGTDRRAARAGGLELLERVGLDTRLAGRYPAQLSGGQQQRVGGARALAADPPVMLMDEPFSAVDPVVRQQLQELFGQLQADLGKTILFVTHDIDEAIRLGDRVAVLRVGGTLAQFAPPGELLRDPVDDFVADFVGRDRGYRSLAFLSAPALRLHPEPTVRLGATPDEVAAAAGGSPWVLVLADSGRPQGWVEVARAAGPVGAASLHRGGTGARQDGSLRSALDAALSSPSRRGVVADAAGRFVGTVRATEVLAAIEDGASP